MLDFAVVFINELAPYVMIRPVPKEHGNSEDA